MSIWWVWYMAYITGLVQKEIAIPSAYYSVWASKHNHKPIFCSDLFYSSIWLRIQEFWYSAYITGLIQKEIAIPSAYFSVCSASKAQPQVNFWFRFICMDKNMMILVLGLHNSLIQNDLDIHLSTNHLSASAVLFQCQYLWIS